MAHAFAVSSVVRGYRECKDVCQPLHSLKLLLSVAQFHLMSHLDLGDLASASQDGSSLAWPDPFRTGTY